MMNPTNITFELILKEKKLQTEFESKLKQSKKKIWFYSFEGLNISEDGEVYFNDCCIDWDTDSQDKLFKFLSKFVNGYITGVSEFGFDDIWKVEFNNGNYHKYKGVINFVQVY